MMNGCRQLLSKERIIRGEKEFFVDISLDPEFVK